MHFKKLSKLLLAGLLSTQIGAFAVSSTWQSTTSQDWNDPSNWTNGVPVNGYDVVFPADINLQRNIERVGNGSGLLLNTMNILGDNYSINFNTSINEINEITTLNIANINQTLFVRANPEVNYLTFISVTGEGNLNYDNYFLKINGVSTNTGTFTVGSQGQVRVFDMATTPGRDVINYGLIGGIGTIGIDSEGIFTNYGEVFPGNGFQGYDDIAPINVAGNYRQMSSGILRVKIDSNSINNISQLLVNSTAQLSGTLIVSTNRNLFSKPPYGYYIHGPYWKLVL